MYGLTTLGSIVQKKEPTHVITAKWKTEEVSPQRKIKYKEKNRLISTKTDTDRK